MDEILELINLDIEVQENLLKSHDNKLNLKKKIEKEKKEISEYSWTAVKEKLIKEKQENEIKINNEMYSRDDELNKKIESLKNSFKENFDEWSNKILERCIR